MSDLEALILGIIQGLTEYLPVSSSGHLELSKALLGIEVVDHLLFDVILHFATALSTVVVFRKEINGLIKGAFSSSWNESKQFILFIIVSAIPAIIVGLFFEDTIEGILQLERRTKIITISVFLFITGLLLLSTYYTKKRNGELSMNKVILIGIAQAIATLPGISRSGSTISTSLLLNVENSKASYFSFLMVVPPIVGYTLLKLVKEWSSISSGAYSISTSALIIGFVSSFVVGLFACKWMLQIVRKGKLIYFAYYCFLISGACIIYSFI
ncbi:MAG: undecaprenyl-diphosphate phosphatase [Cyclobacteriaceae bacterium]